MGAVWFGTLAFFAVSRTAVRVYREALVFGQFGRWQVAILTAAGTSRARRQGRSGIGEDSDGIGQV